MSTDPDAFDLASVERQIAGTTFAGRILYFPSVGSTNALALQAAQAGARGGVWVADEQTAGRGRGGHRWHSAAGDGLYVSVLIVPRLAMTRALWLSLAAGLAAQAAIHETTGLAPDIRWPNDLLLHRRKCGGILVETAVEGEMLRYAVIGIGINVNHAGFPAEIESLATSLRIETGSFVSRESLLAALLRSLDSEIRLLEQEDASGLLERFTAASTWVRGKRVRVDEAGDYTGQTAGLDARGFLRIQGDDGAVHTVLSGCVREE